MGDRQADVKTRTGGRDELVAPKTGPRGSREPVLPCRHERFVRDPSDERPNRPQFVHDETVHPTRQLVAAQSTARAGRGNAATRRVLT